MSRATLIDERQEDKEPTTEVFNEEESQETPEVAQEKEPDIPEKYKGKSLEEIVQMHQEAEKLLGRQSSEVGELRKVVDDYISTELTQNQTPVQTQPEVEDDVDYFTDPQAAVNRAIENHPKIKEAEQYNQQYKKQTALAHLEAKHSDMQTILQDPKFAEWVKGSKTRTRLFVEADQQYNYESADELFSLWKERNQMVKQTATVEKQARKQQLKSATTGAARGSTQTARKKTYRRADIIKLMRTDPDRYAAMSDEIFKAYAEGRVK